MEKRIELRSMEDLAYLASSSPLGAVIQHFKDEAGNDFYFMIGGTMHETFVHYYRGKRPRRDSSTVQTHCHI